jgi:signal transduction histidine kinase
MLVPRTQPTRSPAADFTVLATLVVGLLVWLVLACFGVARAQREATARLQREVAQLVASQVGAQLASVALAPQVRASPVASDTIALRGALRDALAAAPDLARLADSTGLAVDLIRSHPVLAPALVETRTMAQGAPALITVRARQDARIPPVLLAVVVALLSVTTALTGVLLWRLLREQAAAHQRSAFASTVSHELRTPLAQILLFAETLQLGRARTSGDRELALSAIVQETRRLMRLVDNVLRFTRLEQGAPHLRQEPVRVSDLVAETAAQFAPLARTSQVSIAVEPHTEAVALADPDAVRQVLLNLLDNAVKHGPPSQQVTARVEADGVQVRLIVEDEGPGIALGDRERIWHAFERGSGDAEGRTPAGSGGAGLGLMIVRALTEAMGGDVRCEPAHPTGPGARFIVGLPALRQNTGS